MEDSIGLGREGDVERKWAGVGAVETITSFVYLLLKFCLCLPSAIKGNSCSPCLIMP